MLFQDKNLFLLSGSCVVALCVWTPPLLNLLITRLTLWLSLSFGSSEWSCNKHGGHISLHTDFTSSGCVPRSGIILRGGSYVSSIFNVLNSLHTVLHRDYANLQCPQQQGFCFLFVFANTCHLRNSHLDEGRECMHLGSSLLHVSNTGPRMIRHSKTVEGSNNFLDLSLGWDKKKCPTCYRVPAVRRANLPSGFSSPLCPIFLARSHTAY